MNNQNVELACKEVVFHFNKGHLADPTIPMWVIKAKGKSFYVDHVECDRPWTTKETPDNSHTKGSLKVKRCYLMIDGENTAHIKELTPEISERLANPNIIIRVISTAGVKFRAACDTLGKTVKLTGGGCGTMFFLTEFNDAQEFVMFKMTLADGADLRELTPNEHYYKIKDLPATSEGRIIEDDDDWSDYEDE